MNDNRTEAQIIDHCREAPAAGAAHGGEARSAKRGAVMFAFDSRDHDGQEARDSECWSCGRPITNGTQCTGCWTLEDGAAWDEGGESG